MYRSCAILASLWFAAVAWSKDLITTELPVLTNAWDMAHLCITDKDTNLVIVNANALYLSTLQASFPEIETVEDVRGKTDYDFYPTELAEKYRADDRRVLEGGVAWETIEENQPIGGDPTYVYVSKTPLRDEAGAIYALRIAFYSIPAPNQTVLPVIADPWLATHTQVIDKDTNSVFLNANEVFLATLRPSFPEIRSVTNLIGRDDYYFYPTELAEKYRADDRRVIESGQPWQGVEVNQPLGGQKHFAQVTKTPLRNTANEIFGLRIVAWSVPEISIARVGDTLILSWDAMFAEFDLQSADRLDSTSVWTSVTAPRVETGERVEASVPADGPGRFFRLEHAGQ